MAANYDLPPHRSACPINLAVEVIGDKWSLVILRDMIFGGWRHYRELLARSMEGIASNILADRLAKLTESGLLTKAPDPTHKQKALYSLTEMGVQLLPVMVQLSSWGRRFLPVSPELSIRSELMELGGPDLWADFMDQLREEHMGTPRPPSRTGHADIRAFLQAAYERVKAEGLGAAPSATTATT
jgi:DNA-binding HxlR family transcriptional regulator